MGQKIPRPEQTLALVRGSDGTDCVGAAVAPVPWFSSDPGRATKCQYTGGSGGTPRYAPPLPSPLGHVESSSFKFVFPAWTLTSANVALLFGAHPAQITAGIVVDRASCPR